MSAARWAASPPERVVDNEGPLPIGERPLAVYGHETISLVVL